ncbi:hypothetical protein HU200_036131 [Digitaria exilis]|uniref:Uncharacterized protein n=1 Tax=Digitaria exilis TaxID=1010633 RepID=A0A835BDX8_9POAL|nr:hypothetical protein HU200_036131 [Digitaria exilis]
MERSLNRQVQEVGDSYSESMTGITWDQEQVNYLQSEKRFTLKLRHVCRLCTLQFSLVCI